MNESQKLKIANLGLFIVAINAIINLFSGEWLRCGLFFALYVAIVFFKGKIREAEEKRIKAEKEQQELSDELEKENAKLQQQQDEKDYMADLQKKENEKYANLNSRQKKDIINQLADDIHFESDGGGIKRLMLEKFHRGLRIPRKFFIREFENFLQHPLKIVEHMVLEENKEEINKLVSSYKESKKIERERIAKLDLEINQVEANRLGLSLDAYILKKKREETKERLRMEMSRDKREELEEEED